LGFICGIDWQAIATFVTGVLAVGAAMYVARKQTGIQNRQTRLIENDLKIQLLDKRSECVASMRKIYHAWQREMELSDDDWKEFYFLSQDVILLYPKDVTKKLDDAMSGIFWAKQHHKRSHQYHQRGKTEEADKRLEDAFAEEDKVMKIMPTLLDELIAYTRVDAWE
jgi:hypothetical protein